MRGTKLTLAPYVRSYGRQPSWNTVMTWVFQRSKTQEAYKADLFGERVMLRMSLTHAEHWLTSGLWALLS